LVTNPGQLSALKTKNLSQSNFAIEAALPRPLREKDFGTCLRSVQICRTWIVEEVDERAKQQSTNDHDDPDRDRLRRRLPREGGAMKLYLAARFERRPEMFKLAGRLAELGHVITSGWVASCAEPDAVAARQDLVDLLAADSIILFTENPVARLPFTARGGRHVKFGIALQARKRLFIVGPRENLFHELPGVLRFPDTESMLRMLDVLAPPRRRRDMM
jgi:hypothetical protein